MNLRKISEEAMSASGKTSRVKFIKAKNDMGQLIKRLVSSEIVVNESFL